jgi:hypothetical protein
MSASQDHSQYDVAVAYRIYPKVAKPALGLPSSDDKYRLAEICLCSFKKSLGDLRAKIWVLLDGCPSEYEDLFRKYFCASDLVFVPLKQAGNVATFAKQLDILLEQTDSEFVYFAEDDYFYLPEGFSSMIDFLSAHNDVDFVSPYDHLDCYTMDLHRTPKWLKVHRGRHWRTEASTCLTFLTDKKTLRKTQSVFRRYQRTSLDCSIWLSLSKQRVFNPFFVTRNLIQNAFASKIIVKSWLYCWRQILFGKKWKLWVPVPGLATHLDRNALSPGVDWRGLMEQAMKLSINEVSAARYN